MRYNGYEMHKCIKDEILLKKNRNGDKITYIRIDPANTEIVICGLVKDLLDNKAIGFLEGTEASPIDLTGKPLIDVNENTIGHIINVTNGLWYGCIYDKDEIFEK